ncbi:MAG TPA: hypothetical protein VEL28_06040 [Candidatus Binatia bacterium]|nr:hypothetical protein [Candidatus Binatia bacterium]
MVSMAYWKPALIVSRALSKRPTCIWAEASSVGQDSQRRCLPFSIASHSSFDGALSKAAQFAIARVLAVVLPMSCREISIDRSLNCAARSGSRSTMQVSAA